MPAPRPSERGSVACAGECVTVTTTPGSEEFRTIDRHRRINWPTTERSPCPTCCRSWSRCSSSSSACSSLVDKSALVGFESDVVEFFHKLPDPFERFLIGLSQFVAVLYPIVLVTVFLVLRRPIGRARSAVAGTAPRSRSGASSRCSRRTIPPRCRGAEGAHVDRRFCLSRLRLRRCRVRARGRGRRVSRAPVAARGVGVRRFGGCVPDRGRRERAGRSA